MRLLPLFPLPPPPVFDSIESLSPPQSHHLRRSMSARMAPNWARPVQTREQLSPEAGHGYWKLLDLPTELREEIYSMVLVEPERLLRRHRPDCRFARVHRNWGAENLATPAWSPRRRCDCAKRRNMSLLLVSRPAHVDAARFFWSRNVFSFDGASQFVREVGLSLLPERRYSLRHVVIYDKRQASDAKDDFAMVDRKWNLKGAAADRVWEVIFSCDSLETLQIRPALFMW